LFELGRGEENLHELAGDVADGELAEQLGFTVQASGQPVPEAVFNRLERGERRRVVALRLLEELPARTTDHQPPADPIPDEQPPHEAAGALPLWAPAAR